MFRLLLVMFVGLIVAGCQTSNEMTTITDAESTKHTIIMKDTRPRGLGSREWGTWNQDMPTSPWVYNLTNIVPARNGELSQRFELRNGDCTTNQPPGDSHPNDWTKSQRGHCTSIFQIKQTENNVYQGDKPGTKSGDYSGGHYIGGHPVMMGSICGDRVGLAIKHTGYTDSKFNGWSKDENVTFTSLNSIKNEWVDIVLHWDTTGYRNDKSTFEIYLNGKLAGKWENITNNFFPDLYTFKYGPYRGYMKQHGVTSSTQVIYFDEARTGRSFDAVNPATNRALD